MSLLNQKTTLALCGVVILTGGFFAIKAHSATHHTTPVQNLNLSEAAPITSLDVAKITDATSSHQLSQVDEGLYRLDAKSRVQNALAKQTTVSPDGKHYTITLAKNGKWSNGQPVTAQDFVYSWKRTLNPRSKSEFTYQFANIQNATAIAAGKKPASSLGVTTNGKYQLKITLAKPATYFKQMLASTTFYPLNQKAVNQYGKKYGSSAKTTVYNGPFRLTKWNGTNDNWTLTKNPTYRQKNLVKLNHINFQVLKSNATAYNLYQSKKLDTVTLNGEQTKQNQNNPALKTLSAGRIGFIQYNQKDSLAQNRNLRTALSLAINRQQLAKQVLQNGSKPASTFAIHNMLKNPQTGADFVHDATVKETADYHPQKAQQLFNTALKQLHRRNVTLTITAGDDDTSKQLTEFIQSTLTSHLKHLKINVKSVPFPAMLSAVSKGNFQLNVTSWSMDFADPIQSLQIITSDNNSNMGHYQSQAYDRAIKLAEGPDALKANARYHDLVTAAQTALKDQAVTPLYEGRTSSLVNPNLRGVTYNQFNGIADYRTAYLK